MSLAKTLANPIEKSWTPQTPHAINALKQIMSAPVRGSQKQGSLTRTASDLERRNELGILDMWVDDGTNGNLDKTLRFLRFAAAASNIYRLFTPESRKQHIGALCESRRSCQRLDKSRKENQTSMGAMDEKSLEASRGVNENDPEMAVEGHQIIPNNSYAEEQELLVEVTEATKHHKEGDDITDDNETAKEKQFETLETESVTPPQAVFEHTDGVLVNTKAYSASEKFTHSEECV